MNHYAIEHIPDSGNAYALDEHTLRLVLKVGERFKEIGVLWNSKYNFSKMRNYSRMARRGGDGFYDYYVCDLHSSEVRFAYIFLLKTESDEEYYFSEEGLTKDYDFVYGKYPFFQFPYLNAADVVHTIPWTRDAVFYQIFTDRFRRADSGKDGGYINQAWNAPVNYHSYTGGDLKGITEKLPYLADMGVNALYLTPVYKAKSNHKYNIEDYLTVDPMFGTNDDLDGLLFRAHTLGMRVVTDAVFNHCGKEHPCFRDVMTRGRQSEYFDWFIIHGDFPREEPCNYDVFAHRSNMPKWNTGNPEVREYLKKIALTYLSWGFDGLRLDVADEVSHTFWRELRDAVKKSYPEAVIIGEVWHENNMYLRGDEFDGVMNYKLYKVFSDYFAFDRLDAREAAEHINRVWYKNTLQANEMMLNFLDNHDVPRFLHLCGGDGEKLRAALVALYFSVGMPCIYYGTELPLTGGGDPDNRRAYDWAQKPRNASLLRELAKMKKQLPRGDFYAAEEHGVLVLVREGKEERAKACFGKCAAQGDTIFEYNNIKIVKEKI